MRPQRRSYEGHVGLVLPGANVSRVRNYGIELYYTDYTGISSDCTGIDEWEFDLATPLCGRTLSNKFFKGN